MTTHYDQMPTLEERVRASHLVVVGRVESIELLKRERVGDIEEQQAIAYVLIEEVLRGAADTHRIGLRFVAQGDPSERRTHPVHEGRRILLMLVPDVGRDARPNTFVPYLRGCYALSTGDSFIADASLTTRKRADSTSKRMTLRKLREIIRAVATAETAEDRSWTKYEPRLVRKPVLPPITELPQPGYGSGPTHAVPTAAAESRVSRRK